MLKTHLFSHSYFTDCFQEYEQRTLYSALAMLLRLINCRFIVIITVECIISVSYNVNMFAHSRNVQLNTVAPVAIQLRAKAK